MTRPAISREQPTILAISWRVILICMPSGWVIASGSRARSSSVRATRPVTSMKARLLTLRLVLRSRLASCDDSWKRISGVSLASCMNWL